MKRTSLPQNLIAATAVAVSIALTSAPALHGQCVSGLGVTPVQAGTQNFGLTSISQDFTTMVSASTADAAPPVSVPAFTKAIVSGTGVWALPVTAPGYEYDPIYRLTLQPTQNPGAYEIMYQTQGFNLPPTAVTDLFSAGGTAWAISNGQIYNIAAAKGTGAAASFKGRIEGATSDGTYAWFSTSLGSLVKINLATGTYAGTVTISDAALGSMSFNGDHLWVAQGQNLLEVDPQSGTNLGPVQFGGSISSVIFDGVYLWIGNGEKAGLQKYDIHGLGFAGDLTPGGSGYGALTFDGAAISAYSFSSPVVTKVRACDMHQYPSTSLPAAPISAVFDGMHTWAFYANKGMISIR